ncbi:DUF4384 domain-containing protein [Myxococcota bacterium]|nr:DUF4384 domain-containing protein [Myxococcota bacterium]
MTPSVRESLDNTSAISAHPSRQAWDRFCLEEASAQERTRLQLHLSECAHCQSSIHLIRLEQSAFAQSFPRLAFLQAISTQTTPAVEILEGSRSLSLEGSRNLGLEGSRNLGLEGSRSLGLEGSRNLGLEGSRSLGLEQVSLARTEEVPLRRQEVLVSVGHGGWLEWLRWGGWLGSVGACGLLLLWLGSVGDPKEIGKSEPLGSEAAPFSAKRPMVRHDEVLGPEAEPFSAKRPMVRHDEVLGPEAEPFSAKRPMVRHDGELWRKKGGGPLLEVFLSRKGVQALVRSGASFEAGDQLGFCYQGAGYGFLTLVLVDAKGSVSWLYPSSAAPSIPIAAQGRLQDAVELDSSLGRERIIAFFAERPLHAKRILAALSSPKEGPQQLATGERVFVRSFLLKKK